MSHGLSMKVRADAVRKAEESQRKRRNKRRRELYARRRAYNEGSKSDRLYAYDGGW